MNMNMYTLCMIAIVFCSRFYVDSAFCINDHLHKQLWDEDPQRQIQFERQQTHSSDYIHNIKRLNANKHSTHNNDIFLPSNVFTDPKRRMYQAYNHKIDEMPLIKIPVVFHILYENSTENISESQIDSQIKQFNLDFRALNNEIVNNSYKYYPTLWHELDRIGDAKLQFFKFKTIRKQISNSTETCAMPLSVTEPQTMKYSSLGGSDAWDPETYLNIWICNIYPRGYPQGGYAWPSCLYNGSGIDGNDGVVLRPNVIGSIRDDINNNDNDKRFFLHSRLNLGHVATHEVGHWLHLFHTWGLAVNNSLDLCQDMYPFDDNITDTPTCGFRTTGLACPLNPLNISSLSDTCNNSDPETGINLRDMYENHMSYADDKCRFMFTPEQVWKMRSVLSDGGCRSEIYKNGATWNYDGSVYNGSIGDSFICDDGCRISYDWSNDNYCDCSNCEDEINTGWNCDNCKQGCRNYGICVDYRQCFDEIQGTTRPNPGAKEGKRISEAAETGIIAGGVLFFIIFAVICGGYMAYRGFRRENAREKQRRTELGQYDNLDNEQSDTPRKQKQKGDTSKREDNASPMSSDGMYSVDDESRSLSGNDNKDSSNSNNDDGASSAAQNALQMQTVPL